MSRKLLTCIGLRDLASGKDVDAIGVALMARLFKLMSFVLGSLRE